MTISKALRDMLKASKKKNDNMYTNAPTPFSKFLNSTYLTNNNVFSQSIETVEWSLESLEKSIKLKDPDYQADTFARNIKEIKEAVYCIEVLFEQFTQIQEEKATKTATNVDVALS